MKKIKFCLGVAFVLAIAAGAYATSAANRLTPTTVYYETGSGSGQVCTSTIVDIEPCNLAVGEPCEKNIEDVGPTQVFRSQKPGDPQHCSDPYKRP